MIFEYAARNLLRNRARTALSMVGIALGAVLVTVIFAMTGDMSGVMASPFRRLFGGEMLIMPESTSFGRLSHQYLGFKHSEDGLAQALNMQTLAARSADFGTPRELFIVTDSFDDQGARVPVVAQDFEFGKSGIRVTKGRGFSAGDEGQYVVMLNDDVREKYPVDSEINLFLPWLNIDAQGNIRFDYSLGEPVTFQVIGHYRSPIPTPLVNNNPPVHAPMVLMPKGTFRAIADVRPGFSMAAILPQGDRATSELARQTLTGYRVMGSEEMALAIFTGARIRDRKDDMLAAVSGSFMWAIFVVSAMIVAVTLLVALRLRRKEFAILRAEGWKRGHLLKALMVESSLIGFSSGLIGYFVGCLLLYAAVSRLGGDILDLAGISPLNGLAIALAFGSIAVISNLISVIQASRVKPAEVIRGA